MVDNIIQGMFFVPIIFAYVCTIVFMISAVFSIIYSVFGSSDKMIAKMCQIFEPESSAFYANNIGMTIAFIFFFFGSLKLIDLTTMTMVIGAASIPSLWYTIYIIDVWRTLYKANKNRNK